MNTPPAALPPARPTAGPSDADTQPVRPAEHPVLAATRAWIDQAVIGLNLCPFAKAVQTKGLVRYVLCEATDTAGLRVALVDELRRLQATPADEVDTTVLVHPQVLQDFLDFNDFLAEADAALVDLDLDGVLQIASFHPDYQFGGTPADDITNATNRSPWPTLHLLREDSIDRAVAAFPEAEAIYEANMATLQALGPSGWAELQQRWLPRGGDAGTAAVGT